LTSSLFPCLFLDQFRPRPHSFHCSVARVRRKKDAGFQPYKRHLLPFPSRLPPLYFSVSRSGPCLLWRCFSFCRGLFLILVLHGRATVFSPDPLLPFFSSWVFFFPLIVNFFFLAKIKVTGLPLSFSLCFFSFTFSFLTFSSPRSHYDSLFPLPFQKRSTVNDV